MNRSSASLHNPGQTLSTQASAQRLAATSGSTLNKRKAPCKRCYIVEGAAAQHVSSMAKVKPRQRADLESRGPDGLTPLLLACRCDAGRRQGRMRGDEVTASPELISSYPPIMWRAWRLGLAWLLVLESWCVLKIRWLGWPRRLLASLRTSLAH